SEAGRRRSSTWATGPFSPPRLRRLSIALRRWLTLNASALGGFIAARRSRNRLIWGSRPMGSRSCSSECERPPHGGRPPGNIQSVNAEQRDREPVHTEGHAAGVREFALLIGKAPHGPEVFAVVVEAHAGRSRRTGIVGNEQLELQRLLALAERHDLPHPTEERVTGDVHRVGQTQHTGESLGTLHPLVPQNRDFLR